MLAICAVYMGIANLGAQSGPPRDIGIFVKKIDSLSPDFIRGVDISSVLSLEKSGVVFRNAAGDPQDIFKTLKDYGVNSVRIRVWNHPFTAGGNGYGGGNCDIDTAIAIGKRATAFGLTVLLDYHYSDFWADPLKQQAPREWQSMAVAEKAAALYAYTKDSLGKALDAGVDVRMVQIGNETTGFFCGEKNWIQIASLMREGSRAVRDVAAERNRKIEIAVHFTNPEKAGEYERYARILEKQKVDYDVFATSWYPYWHGTPGNLTAVLKKVAEISGKKVLCAEVSYAYTYDNGDGFGNSISADTVCAKPYPVTVQGQADAVREAMAAVAAVGEAGIGVYYWEPAWIPVPGKDYADRQKLWELYGSGWASSYAAEYDPGDAGKYFGGSSWDNQAMFDLDGKPLASLAVWGLAGIGAVTAVKTDAIEESVVRVRIGDVVGLPETVTVICNNGDRKTAAVVWETAASVAGDSPDYGRKISLSSISSRGVAEYRLQGAVADTGIPAIAKIAVVEKNYIENYSFEDADVSMWNIENIGGKTSELSVQEKTSDAKSGNRALHFWSKDKVAFRVEQTVTGLTDGIYKFSIVLHGGDAKNQDMYLYAVSGGATYKTATNVDGWRNFRQPVIAAITVQNGTVTVGAYISCDANGWGSLDDFILTPVE